MSVVEREKERLDVSNDNPIWHIWPNNGRVALCGTVQVSVNPVRVPGLLGAECVVCREMAGLR